jgi:hypothetical protein
MLKLKDEFVNSSLSTQDIWKKYMPIANDYWMIAKKQKLTEWLMRFW